jgi:hypothetical protein
MTVKANLAKYSAKMVAARQYLQSAHAGMEEDLTWLIENDDVSREDLYSLYQDVILHLDTAIEETTKAIRAAASKRPWIGTGL